MTDDSGSISKETAMNRLRELVLDHLGMPRPMQSQHITALQNDLLPGFMTLARYASMASSPIPLAMEKKNQESADPTYEHLHRSTETQSDKIGDLNLILEDLGVHDLLDEVGQSSDATMVSQLPVDDYEIRLMRETGHRNPAGAVHGFLEYAAKHPQMMSDSAGQLEQAKQSMLQAHRQITLFLNVNMTPPPSPPTVPGDSSPTKPKRLKLFGGLSKLASGLVLLSGNAVLIPTVVIGSVTALPVLASIAAGIAAVGEGVSAFRREGE